MAQVKLPRYLLEFVVFISGAVVMVLELTGSRILSPYLGTSTFVWTSLIGIILGSLSLGYHLGGKFADKKASAQGLSLILFIAAIFIGLASDLSGILLQQISTNLNNLRLGSVLAATLIFAPASIFLGMVSPYAIRLKLNTLKTSGQTIGNLYAISTIGSIVGTFLAGFYLLSYFGSIQLMYLLAITLTLAALLLYRGFISLIQLGFILLITFIIINPAQASNLIDIDSEYSRIQIYDQDNIRYLEIGNNDSSAMYLDSDELVYPYTKAYDTMLQYFNHKPEKTLMLGGGAFSYPKNFLTKYPHASIDVVEIDPTVTKLAEKYFKLTASPRLKIITADARTYLNQTREKYDVIFGDAFKSFYSIPYQLTTKEAVQKHYDALSDNGLVILNIAGAIDGDLGKFFRAEYRTYKAVFPQVYVFANNSQAPENLILVALKSSHAPELNNPKNLWTKEIPLDVPVLTDNFAPVDQYMMELLDYVKL